MERVEDEPEIGGNGPGSGVFLEIVGADEEHYSSGMQGEDVFLETDEDAARGVAANPAIDDFEIGKGRGESGTPALSDRIAEEDDSLLVALHLPGPSGATFGPELLKPRVAADRT